MASKGSNDTSGLKTNVDGTVQINVETDNRFSVLCDREQNEGFKEQRSKRKRVNTGSVDSDTFYSLSNDDKLAIIFEKLIDIEHKQTQIETLEKDMNSTTITVTNMQVDVDKHNQMLKLRNYKSLDLESRSRRKNLIFRGLFESRNENCYDLIYEFLEDQLQLDDARSSVVIDRAHRLGRRNQRTLARRPIIAAFRDFADTERILSRGIMLKGTSFGKDRDYPAEISHARGLLWNRYKELKRAGKDVVIQYPAKLVADGKVVENLFPDWYEIVRGHRIEPYISESVAAANERAKQVKVPAGRTQGSSYRAESTVNNSNTTGGRFLNSNNNEAPSGVQSQETINDRRSLANIRGRIEEEEGEGDDADVAFYSGYVSRMDRSKTLRKQQVVSSSAVTPEEPRSARPDRLVAPTILSMKEFPPLTSKSINAENQASVNKTNSTTDENKRQQNKQEGRKHPTAYCEGDSALNLSMSQDSDLRPHHDNVCEGNEHRHYPSQTPVK